jgi:hypothetical protein
MENVRTQAQDSTGCRSSQPFDAHEPMGTVGPLHGRGLEKYCQSGTSGLCPPPSTATRNVDGSRRDNEVSARQSEAKSAPRHDDVAVLGFAPAEDEHAVCAEITPAELSGRVTVANVLRLLERQNYRCALTGRHVTPDLASLDHIVPVRCGGEHRIENAQVLHRNVNRAKTTMTNEEFIALCREVVEHAAQQNFN